MTQGFEVCDKGDGAIDELSSLSRGGSVLIVRDLKDIVAELRERNGAPPSELHVLKVQLLGVPAMECQPLAVNGVEDPSL